jgi:ankyrin repeat protein
MYTPLHVAALMGHGVIIDLLADKGADMNVVEGEHSYTVMWSSVRSMNPAPYFRSP